jgi:hypothetical protein
LCERSHNRETPLIHEKHHILPKCFKVGGEHDIKNIAYLTPREHYICHKILTKVVEDKELNAKLVYAVWQFTTRLAISSREYENLKINLSKAYKGIPKSEAHKNALRKTKSDTSRMGNPKGYKSPFRGMKRDAEIGKKISSSKKGKNVGIDNHFYGRTHTEKTKQILKELNTGKHLSEETRNKISINSKGKTPWNKGTSQSKETSFKASQSLSGRKAINNGYKNKRVKVEELPFFLDSGWVLGMIKKNL